jgi:uncharacterized lipoprotein YajG
MNTKHLFTVLACALALAACSKQPSPTETVASAEAPLTDEALDQANVPVKEDFEELASREVTEENLDDQLAQLTQQIESDK